jgi:hypothetical protein
MRGLIILRGKSVAQLQHGGRILLRLWGERTHFGAAVVLRSLVMT